MVSSSRPWRAEPGAYCDQSQGRNEGAAGRAVVPLAIERSQGSIGEPSSMHLSAMRGVFSGVSGLRSPWWSLAPYRGNEEWVATTSRRSVLTTVGSRLYDFVNLGTRGAMARPIVPRTRPPVQLSRRRSQRDRDINDQDTSSEAVLWSQSSIIITIRTHAMPDILWRPAGVTRRCFSIPTCFQPPPAAATSSAFGPCTSTPCTYRTVNNRAGYKIYGSYNLVMGHERHNRKPCGCPEGRRRLAIPLTGPNQPPATAANFAHGSQRSSAACLLSHGVRAGPKVTAWLARRHE